MGPTFCGYASPSFPMAADEFNILTYNFISPGNCTASCGAKAECDPDNWGSAYVSASTCPLNVCCSKYVSSHYNGVLNRSDCSSCLGMAFVVQRANFAVTPPLPDHHAMPQVRTCLGSSAIMRPMLCLRGLAMCFFLRKFLMGFSHTSSKSIIILHRNVAELIGNSFAFGTIDPTTLAVQATDETESTLLQEIRSLKFLQPDLQLWLSLGGWSFSDADQPTRYTFSDLAASEADQKAFFASLISFMGTYGFDGVDIDWWAFASPHVLDSMLTSFSEVGNILSKRIVADHPMITIIFPVS